MPAPGGILALDLSTKTGWAVGSRFEAPAHGVWLLPGGIANLGRVFSSLAASLEDAIRLFRPVRIFFVPPLSKHQTTAELLIGLSATVKMISYEQGVPVGQEAESTVRKHVLGSGRFSSTKEAKAAAFAWCRSKGWTPCDDNAADALVDLHYALVFHSARQTA
jgi:crossover junction endodeoxyribonuclease RuvC